MIRGYWFVFSPPFSATFNVESDPVRFRILLVQYDDGENLPFPRDENWNVAFNVKDVCGRNVGRLITRIIEDREFYVPFDEEKSKF